MACYEVSTGQAANGDTTMYDYEPRPRNRRLQIKALLMQAVELVEAECRSAEALFHQGLAEDLPPNLLRLRMISWLDMDMSVRTLHRELGHWRLHKLAALK